VAIPVYAVQCAARWLARSLAHKRTRNDVYDADGRCRTDPIQFGSFYDRLDASGTLEIRTPVGKSNDSLELQITGGNMLVSMTLGTPVRGADPGSFISVIPTNSITNSAAVIGETHDCTKSSLTLATGGNRREKNPSGSGRVFQAGEGGRTRCRLRRFNWKRAGLSPRRSESVSSSFLANACRSAT
jgi:hypothetical protein